MKKAIIWLIILAFVFSGLAAAVFSQPATAETSARVIKTAPPKPVFTDAERQAELARRRAAVAAKMADAKAVGFHTFLAELAAPYDDETIERWINEVRPMVDGS